MHLKVYFTSLHMTISDMNVEEECTCLAFKLAVCVLAASDRHAGQRYLHLQLQTCIPIVACTERKHILQLLFITDPHQLPTSLQGAVHAVIPSMLKNTNCWALVRILVQTVCQAQPDTYQHSTSTSTAVDVETMSVNPL